MLLGVFYSINIFSMRVSEMGKMKDNKFLKRQKLMKESTPEQFDFKPIMSQQKLFAQKDALQNLVKNVWEGCLKALDLTFPGLVGENQLQLDEHVVSVKSDFKKPPRTDERILFIKQTVQDAIAKTSMLRIKFDEKTKTTQEQILKGLLERMIASALIELILQDVGESLSWCECHAEYKRITLALLLVNEIREKFPNKNQRIVYTSFASGTLLQDYVVLGELLLSHTNILVNFIDLDYPDILPALAKKDLRSEGPNSLHMLEMKTKQESADMIDSFKVKIAQIISEKGSSSVDYNFEVKIYHNAYEYIKRVQNYSDEKSNILIMVDPSTGSFGIEDFPSLANVINVWINQEDFPVFTLYLPRHHGTRLYQAIEVADPQIIQDLHQQLQQLVVSTGASKHYTARLTNELLKKGMFLDKQITDEVLASSFPQLMETRANRKKDALEYGYTGDNLLQPLTPVTLGDAAILLSWGTDAHISFQDLVWDVLAPNAIVYQFYAIDPTKSDDENNKIIKINPEVYKQEDVVVPNSGGFLGDLYKRIL